MSVDRVFRKEDLLSLRPKHATFVGIDSDGCVFDTMEIKQKRCFHKLIVSHWHLEPIEKYVREAAEFVNLHSIYRGQNRFPCLLMGIDIIRDRPEVKASGVALPAFTSLKKLIASGLPLGNPTLEKLVAETHDPELASILQWSKDVNKDIARTVKNIPPFKGVLPSFEKILRNSDAICVSQTPTEALVREWEENNIMKYVAVIAGQELGTKTEHIAMATKDRYQPDNILMIGDAPGDHKAAKGNHALFYPINPGHEAASWERFHSEAYDRFLKGEYKGAYEDALIREFNALLPDTPPWKRPASGK